MKESQSDFGDSGAVETHLKVTVFRCEDDEIKIEEAKSWPLSRCKYLMP